MFLRESRHRRPDGTEVVYLQLVENVWSREKGRAQTRILHNCGRADDPAVRDRLRELARSILRRVSPEELTGGRPGWKLLDAWPFGDLYVLEQLWRRVGLDRALPARVTDATRSRLPVERACFAMVANRCCAPASKLYCFEKWLQKHVRIEGTESLKLQHLYRSMDFFEKHKEQLEKDLYFRVADLFSVDVDLVFYDTTSLHFEIDREDADGAEDATVPGSKLAGGRSYEALRQRGRSKDKRGDVPQIVVGMAMTRDGLPIRSWVFRGDTVDVETVRKVREDLRGWKLTRSIFVGDAGMVSEANLAALSAGGGKYILCMPMRAGSEVAQDVLTRPGRYKTVAGNLRIKQVSVGEGERRRRYVVCHNPAEAERQLHHREQLLAELREALAGMKAPGEDEDHTKAMCRLRASERYGKYLRQDGGRLAIDEAKVRRAAHFDGKFVVHSNDDSLLPEDLALGYKQQAEIERAWRLIKQGLRIRPLFHWAAHRICAHVSLTMISLLLERVAERLCDDTWRNIRDDLRSIKLGHLSSPDGEVWQVTDPTPKALDRLKKLGIQPPPPVLRMATRA
jgi:transposase